MQQQQQRSPRPAAQRRTNRYRTARIAGVGIRQGLRRTGRLFARGGGRRRRSAAAAGGADDSNGDGDDSGENCVGREAMAGGNRDGSRNIPVGEQYFGHGDGGDTRRTNGYSARNINAGEDPSQPSGAMVLVLAVDPTVLMRPRPLSEPLNRHFATFLSFLGHTCSEPLGLHWCRLWRRLLNWEGLRGSRVQSFLSWPPIEDEEEK